MLTSAPPPSQPGHRRPRSPQTELSQPYVGTLLAKARERWAKSARPVTAVRVTVREILDRHGRVMEASQLAAALLAERGCALGDATARLAVAQACLPPRSRPRSTWRTHGSITAGRERKS